MASQEFQSQVTVVPADWANDVNDLVYDVFAAAKTRPAARTALGLGSLALQNSNGVVIDGGFLNGVTIGNLGPAVGRFSNLQVLNAPTTPYEVVNLSHLSQVLASVAGPVITTKGDLLVHDGVDRTRLPLGADLQVLTADSTEPTGVKWANLPAQFAPPITSRGDLIVHNGAVPVRQAVGANGQVLTANSSTATGVQWAPLPASFVPPVTAPGDLMVRGPSAVQRLAVGADNQVLTADSTTLLGVKWATLPPASVPYVPPTTTKGDLLVHNGTTNVRQAVGATPDFALVVDPSTPTGVAWKQQIGASALTSPLAAKGDLLAFDGTVHQRLPVGTNGQVLSAASSAAFGVRWITPYASPTTTKGDLSVNNGLTEVRLAVGANNQVLTADSTAASGLAWKTQSTPLTTKGDIFVHSTVDARLPVGTNGQVLTADSTAATGLRWVTNSATFAPPTTTKGDAIAHDGTTSVRFPVGTNGQVLSANSATATGWAWITPFSNPMTTKGDLIGFNGTIRTRVPVGTNGQVLTANSAATNGIEWVTPAAAFVNPLTTKGDLMVHDGTTTIRQSVGTNGQTLVADSTAPAGVAWKAPFVPIRWDVSRDLTSSITAGVSLGFYPSPRAFTLTGVRAEVLESSSSGVITIDIKLNGTSIFSTLLTIDTAETTSVTATIPAVLSTTAIPDGGRLTADVVTGGTGAKGLVLTLFGT